MPATSPELPNCRASRAFSVSPASAIEGRSTCGPGGVVTRSSPSIEQPAVGVESCSYLRSKGRARLRTGRWRRRVADDDPAGFDLVRWKRVERYPEPPARSTPLSLLCDAVGESGPSCALGHRLFRPAVSRTNHTSRAC